MSGSNNSQSTRKRRKENGTSLGSLTRNSKRKSNGGCEVNELTNIASAYEEYCELPFTLASILIDEFDVVVISDCGQSSLNGKHRMVHELPSKLTVLQILEQYQRKRTNSNKDNTQKLKQITRFVDGLALLFDESLPLCLLYREERPQYESLQNDKSLSLKRPCEIYGATFLLRLFRRLPHLLVHEMKQEMDVFGPFLSDLVVLLQKNRQACFKNQYRLPHDDELLPFEKCPTKYVLSNCHHPQHHQESPK